MTHCASFCAVANGSAAIVATFRPTVRELLTLASTRKRASFCCAAKELGGSFSGPSQRGNKRYGIKAHGIGTVNRLRAPNLAMRFEAVLSLGKFLIVVPKQDQNGQRGFWNKIHEAKKPKKPNQLKKQAKKKKEKKEKTKKTHWLASFACLLGGKGGFLSIAPRCVM